MAKKILDFDVDDHLDFDVIGIICAFKDYRLCFEINLLLDFKLKRVNDLELTLEKKGSTGLFSFYQYISIDNEQFFLIANKGNHTWFVPEQKHIDYFMMIRNRASFTELHSLMKKLKSIPLINSVIIIDTAKLKSADHFLYIEEEKVTRKGS